MTGERILVVDDEPMMGQLLVRSLGHLGFQVTRVGSGPEALALAATDEFAAVTTDLRMPGMSGLELCDALRASNPSLPVIVITGHADLASAVAAMRVGAYDFLIKPFESASLDFAVKRAIERSSLKKELKLLRSSLPVPAQFGSLIGSSAPMRDVGQLLARVAPSDSSVLVTGESGTGKELVARALHRESRRQEGPFVAINCAALPPQLLESELFGYERGAFTDARTPKAGLFVEADGGTLFLDEVTELPVALQSKLLRALQERVVRPLGGRKEIPFDVRIVAATNVDVDLAVRERRMREDLYFRINVIEVSLPPLRARGNDVIELAEHFLGYFATRMQKQTIGFTPEVVRQLLQYGWPGNVRELQNTIERAVALASHDRITLEDLPPKIVQAKRVDVTDDDTPLVTLEAMEKRHILSVLQRCNGSKSAAARVLGLDRSTLWRKLDRFRLDEEPKPD